MILENNHFIQKLMKIYFNRNLMQFIKTSFSNSFYIWFLIIGNTCIMYEALAQEKSGSSNFVVFNDNQHSFENIVFKQQFMNSVVQIEDNAEYSVVKKHIYPSTGSNKFKSEINQNFFVTKANSGQKSAKSEGLSDEVNEIEEKDKGNVQVEVDIPNINEGRGEKDINEQQIIIQPQDIGEEQEKVKDADKTIKFKVNERGSPAQIVTYDFQKPVYPVKGQQGKVNMGPEISTDRKDKTNEVKSEEEIERQNDEKGKNLQSQNDQKLKITQKDLTIDQSKGEKGREVSNIRQTDEFLSQDERKMIQGRQSDGQEEKEGLYFQGQLGIGVASLIFIAFACFVRRKQNARHSPANINLQETSLIIEQN